ncbi:hypothetical protein AC781_02030 [Akkermansia glycaniphila]|nr:hypothetical protein AC781_02030 [Akkermansia glycaniphila]
MMAGCLLAAPEDSLQKAEKLMKRANKLEQKGFLYAATQATNAAKDAMVKLKDEHPDFRSDYVESRITTLTAKAEALAANAEAAPADLPKEVKLPDCFVAPSEEAAGNKMDATVQRMYTGNIVLTSRGEQEPVVIPPVRGEKYVPGYYTTRSEPVRVVQPQEEVVAFEETTVEVTPPWDYVEPAAPAPAPQPREVVVATPRQEAAVPAPAPAPRPAAAPALAPVVQPAIRVVEESTRTTPPSGSGRMTGRSRF